VRPANLILLLGVAVLVALGVAGVLPWWDAVAPALIVWTLGLQLAERAAALARSR
jgi:hypothetical protein